MKFGTLPIAAAEGAILAHSVAAGARRLAKGTRLSAADIAAATAAGIASVTAVRLDPDDVDEDTAAAIVGAALCGPHLCAEPAVHGRVNLVAAADGLIVVDAAQVAALNAVDEAVTLATAKAFARLAAGDVAATVKIITFAAPSDTVARCRAIAAGKPLRLAPFTNRSVTLLQTILPGTSAKMLAKTADVTRARAESLGLDRWSETRLAHDEAALARALRENTADVVLVAGASATTDRRDVVPAAIARAGGEVLRLGMPVEPGNLLCLGRIGAAAVIGMPGCARSPKRNGFDWVIERLFAGMAVSADDIAAMGAGGLLTDVPRPEPRRAHSQAPARTGAVVLAAGRSVRMGANKLLADVGGRPVLTHVLDTVRESGIEAIVVTGHAESEIAALAAASDFPSVHAPRHAEGLSQSLAAGIRAVPAGWTAALVMLGDMPEVRAADIRAVANAAREDGIVVPTHAGKRGNPVAWGRRFFADLARIEGDVGGKALLAAFADDIIEVRIDADGILVDVDTPEALDAVRRRHAP